jgi:tRNA-2-methylthio-N6-dimethylallyladenosine synthase
MKYFIKTFGCQLNVADSERITAAFTARGMEPAKNYQEADYVIINTCMVRQSAENRIYGLVNNLAKLKTKKLTLKQNKFATGGPRTVRRRRSGTGVKIILTGCIIGLALRDKTGKYLQRLKSIMPAVDEFLPIEDVGFDNNPLRTNKISAWVPISNGCNNLCSFCVVPFTRGREISRPYEDVIKVCRELKKLGYKNITLLGQNVNSYGADLIKSSKFKVQSSKLQCKIKNLKPVYVKHLGRLRIPTLFPHLLEAVAKMGFEKVDFISSNPWDFSDELIKVVAKNKNITRTIHLPVQSGDNSVLKRMNRFYTSDEYLKLITNLKFKIKNLKLTTDVIVGFCGETDKEFRNTVKLCKKVNFEKAYIAMYSPRPMTAATKSLKDDVPYAVKKKRWQILENLINKKYASKKSL